MCVRGGLEKRLLRRDRRRVTRLPLSFVVVACGCHCGHRHVNSIQSVLSRIPDDIHFPSDTPCLSVSSTIIEQQDHDVGQDETH